MCRPHTAAMGAVGSTYNYMGSTYNRLIAKFRAGDLAGALVEQRRAQEGVDILLQGDSYGVGTYVGKAIMELTLGGAHCGPPRYPWVGMSADAKLRLKADLTAIGFFEWSRPDFKE